MTRILLLDEAKEDLRALDGSTRVFVAKDIEDGTIVVVWVIGRRADDEVYRLAVARLATYEGDPRKKAILQQMLDTAFGA